ncbi:MAG: hypothetical protein R3F02_02775 [Thiolinea sp.]
MKFLIDPFGFYKFILLLTINTAVFAETGLIGRMEALEDEFQNYKERFYAGNTEPGQGFNRYPTNKDKQQSGWFIKIPYPIAVKEKLETNDVMPIIMTSLGGSSSQWAVLGTSNIYSMGGALKHPDGFTLYLRPDEVSAYAPDHEIWGFPKKYDWHINYIIVFEEKN